ncbi:hypothetical protein F4821DRAFT_116678 [Hypoxylon rubiginosum]|uniref:Uncharacterized protein n=1 Tax=Hypoxylon rubiginosum TaxID=110542 RepID=A0ACC0D3D8_9PEZI|nr:hypothetical protein F4821DRAFT_116678 [Hypoxylon rubiginosum]
MDEGRRRRYNTVNTLLEGYGSLSVSQLLQPMAPDFHHQVLPASLGMAPRNRESFAQHAAGIFSIFESFRMVPQSVVDGGPGGAVVVHALMRGILKGNGGTTNTDGKEEWKNECVMLIQLSPDGSQVVRVTEFVDSAKALEMARKHAPDDFGCKYDDDDDKNRGRGGRGHKGEGVQQTAANPKSMTLLFGLGVAQVIVVIFLLYVAQGVVF